MAFKSLGPKWEPRRVLKSESSGGTHHDDVVLNLSWTEGALRNLLDDFEGRREKILSDVDLSTEGRRKAVARLVTEIEARQELKGIRTFIERGRKHRDELNSEGMRKPPVPTDLVGAFEYVLTKRDVMAGFKSADFAGQLKVAQEAIQKAGTSAEARQNLIWLLDANLLDEKTTKLAEAALLKGTNPAVANQLDELLGKLEWNGERSVATGALPCAEFNLAKFHEHLREMGPDPARDRAELLKEHGVSIDSNAIRVSEKGAKIPEVYRAVRAVALEKNLPLTLVADDMSEATIHVSEMDQGRAQSGNGAGAAGEK